MSTENKELKPCPFCGGEAEVRRECSVRCKVCGCKTPEYGGYGAITRHITVWNTRPQPASELPEGITQIPTIDQFTLTDAEKAYLQGLLDWGERSERANWIPGKPVQGMNPQPASDETVLVTWGLSDRDRAILKDGVQHVFKGKVYYLYNGGFHYRVKVTPEERDGPERTFYCAFASICNMTFQGELFADMALKESKPASDAVKDAEALIKRIDYDGYDSCNAVVVTQIEIKPIITALIEQNKAITAERDELKKSNKSHLKALAEA